MTGDLYWDGTRWREAWDAHLVEVPEEPKPIRSQPVVVTNRRRRGVPSPYGTRRYRWTGGRYSECSGGLPSLGKGYS